MNVNDSQTKFIFPSVSVARVLERSLLPRLYTRDRTERLYCFALPGNNATRWGLWFVLRSLRYEYNKSLRDVYTSGIHIK